MKYFSFDMYCSFTFQDSEFLAFFDRTSRVMERFLSEPHNDYFADYTGESGKFFQQLQPTNLSLGEQKKQLQTDAVSESRVFFDQNWSRNRLCTSLDWSPQVPTRALTFFKSFSIPNYSPLHTAKTVRPTWIQMAWRLFGTQSSPKTPPNTFFSASLV